MSVFGPQDWVPVNDYVLEIGRLAFRLTPANPDGITSITTLVPVRVRVVRLIDCATLITFDAQPGTGWTPGSGWRIRFDVRDHLTLESVQEGAVVAFGPGMVEGTPSGCP